MTFRTQFDERLRRRSVPGSRLHTTYAPEYDKDGVLNLKANGSVDTYLQIQSHADSVDINIILSRFANGEPDILTRYQTQYMDVTNMPKTLAGALNSVIVAERDFNELPVNVREKFNHSFSEWLASAGSEEWAKKMGFEVRPDVVVTEPTVEPGKVDMNLVKEAMEQ